MESREAIRFATGSSVRPDVLRATSQPTTLADLATNLPYSKETIADATEWYKREGWIKKQADRYIQTVIGAAILPPLDDEDYRGERTVPGTSSDEKTRQNGEDERETNREDLKFIVKSRLRERMLRSESLPVGSSVLATRYGTTPSTAYRTTQLLESKGWFEKSGETYNRTASGDQALDEFKGLLTVTEQALDKRECLRWLGPELADLPVRRLAGAETAVNDAKHVDEDEELFEELTKSGFDRYRGMTTHVSNSAAKNFSPHIEDGAQAELLVTLRVMRNLPLTGITSNMVENGLNAPNFNTLLASQLPISMSIFDDEIVLFGPCPEHVEGEVSGVIVSADERVVGWALDLYSSYRKQSRPPPDHLIQALLERLDPTPRLAGLLSD